MSDDEIFVNKDFMCLRALAAQPDVVLKLHEERWVVEEPKVLEKKRLPLYALTGKGYTNLHSSLEKCSKILSSMK